MPSMFEEGEGVRRYGSPEKGETIQSSPEELEHINLYFGGLSVYSHIPTLMTRWLEELVREGMNADWRKQSRAYHYELGASKDQLREARLKNGQTV